MLKHIPGIEMWIYFMFSAVSLQDQQYGVGICRKRPGGMDLFFEFNSAFPGNADLDRNKNIT